jgi:glutathione peroxidase
MSESVYDFTANNIMGLPQVTFPMFDKVEVNGPNTHPLFAYLKKEAPGALGTTAIKWNFTKFLVDRDGTVLQRFAPSVEPSEIAPRIAELL